MLAHYEKHCREHADQEWNYFENLELDECITRAPKGLHEKGGKDLCHPHQYRILKQAALESSHVLKQNKADLLEASDFSKVFCAVNKLGGGIHGIGPLTIYDTAHRIGLCLKKKPEKVYLHAGTDIGARCFLDKKKNRDPKIANRDCFPKEFHKYSAAHIENILCIYKNSKAFQRFKK
ncbi:MAG: hypothetical protein PHO37_09215 [Kiritimatiellae bacterium]|nr:hypothetical protein [Kiritimatiellia bacterium]